MGELAVERQCMQGNSKNNIQKVIKKSSYISSFLCGFFDLFILLYFNGIDKIND
jgi:amino acid permease